MAVDNDGVFVPDVAYYPKVAGQLIKSSDWNLMIEELAAAITEALSGASSAEDLQTLLESENGAGHIGLGNSTVETIILDSHKFNMVGDDGGTTDSTAGFLDLVEHARTISDDTPFLIKIFPGSYRITDEIDFTALAGKRWAIINGSSFELVEIIVDIDDHTKTAFKFGNALAPEYQRQMLLDGFLFRKASAGLKAPVAIDCSGIAQSRIRNIACSDWDNTVVRLWAPQNTRHENWTLYGGGRSWLYKNTTGITVQQTGTSLEASAAIFSLADEGKVISIWGDAPNYTRRKTKVVTYVDSTHVTVDSDYTDSVWYDLHFGSPFITTTVASDVITADANCFAAGDVGLTVYVPGAGTDGRMLRGVIEEYLGPTQVRLDNVAVTAITTGEIGCPAIDIHSTGAASGEGGSDNVFHAVQVESNDGVGIILSDLDNLTFTACKFHGNQEPSGANYSLAPMWTEQISGSFQGAFDAQSLGAYKLRAVYQSSCFNFENLVARVAKGEQLARIGERVSGYEGGLIQFDDITLSNASSGLSITDLIADANSPIPGYVLTGKISYNDVDDTRRYLSNAVYGTYEGMFDESDNPIYRAGDQGSVDATLSTTITWDGTAPSLGASHSYSWQRIGKMTSFNLRVTHSTAGVGNTTATIALPSDMPLPVYPAGVAANETICLLSGGLATAETASPSGLARLRRNSAGTGFEIVVTSSSMAAKCAYASGQYFTD